MRRLTAFCMAIVEPGSLVMLDEPTNDVDPVRRRLLWEQVRGLATDGHGVVLVTHNIAEAERAIDRVVVLDHGRVAAAGTPAALAAGREMRLELSGVDDWPLPSWAGAERRDGERRTVTVAQRDAHLAVAWAQSRTTHFALNPVSLEDVYVRLTEEASHDAALAA